MSFTQWTGTVKGILQAVAALIEANEVSLGLQESRIGEKRDWPASIAFVVLGPDGVRRYKPDARSGQGLVAGLYQVPVQVQVIVRDASVGRDEDVTGIMEKLADLIDDNEGLAGTMRHEWDAPFRVGAVPTREDRRGAYETLGILDVAFIISMDRD